MSTTAGSRFLRWLKCGRNSGSAEARRGSAANSLRHVVPGDVAGRVEDPGRLVVGVFARK